MITLHVKIEVLTRVYSCYFISLFLSQTSDRKSIILPIKRIQKNLNESIPWSLTTTKTTTNKNIWWTHYTKLFLKQQLKNDVATTHCRARNMRKMLLVKQDGCVRKTCKNILSMLNIVSLSLIHIWRCRRSTLCRSRWSPYH